MSITKKPSKMTQMDDFYKNICCFTNWPFWKPHVHNYSANVYSPQKMEK
jgi:hypothetical protein